MIPGSNKANIFFSIVIPVYNTPKEYLVKCLSSVVNQDYSNYEIICINDGSTDGSLDILNDFAKNNSALRVISQENKGISASRNRGIREAKGDYMFFVDCDDYYLRDTVLSELANVLQTDDYDCIYFPGAIFGINPDDSTYFVEGKFEERTYNNGWECLEDYCLKSKPIIFGHIHVNCYKTSILRSNNLLFDEKLKFGADDRPFVIQYFYYCKKVFVYSEPIYCWLVRATSLSHTNRRIPKKEIGEEIIIFTEYLYNFVSLKKHYVFRTENIMKYLNGCTAGAILGAHKNNLKIKAKKKILLATAIKSRSVKRIVKSFLLAVSPKLYLKIFK